jgi:hypothetical protein
MIFSVSHEGSITETAAHCHGDAIPNRVLFWPGYGLGDNRGCRLIKPGAINGKWMSGKRKPILFGLVSKNFGHWAKKSRKGGNSPSLYYTKHNSPTQLSLSHSYRATMTDSPLPSFSLVSNERRRPFMWTIRRTHVPWLVHQRDAG